MKEPNEYHYVFFTTRPTVGSLAVADDITGVTDIAISDMIEVSYGK